jgi:ABC-type Na+ transport system ATPase subunit NatA
MITSHNLLEIEDVADDLGMIDGCHLVFSGAVAEVHRTHPGASLEEIFLAQGSATGADAGAELDVEALFA